MTLCISFLLSTVVWTYICLRKCFTTFYLCMQSWRQWWTVSSNWSSKLSSQVVKPWHLWKQSEINMLYCLSKITRTAIIKYSKLFHVSFNTLSSNAFQVFLYRGELYIIPSATDSSSVGFSKDVVPSVAEALSLLSSNPEACCASPKISSAVKRRLKG